MGAQSEIHHRPFSKSEQSRVDANRHFVQCKEDSKEVMVSQNLGGNKQLERSFHFDKVASILTSRHYQ